ncbi:hypothetical protein GCM10011529_04520 [Polymorphobacter glacialis]|uniref:Calcineurin-like phosphoesterase domain-containing protein n=1 Tax=Sandarakinorhabdus glacialis TaxID=1614636 RepID=A0A916ZK83_9SPHN|nr:metallophosphoesterase [Polymorphobacter glacialis]GGE01276.1 hypothetical protein GCM10011529_04520 [Polymorphobacter glacialis]
MRKTLLAFFLLPVGLALFGLWGAWQTPRVVRYVVPIVGLSAPLKIVQLSDTHANFYTMPPRRLRTIVAQANALKPDVIVLSGDYSDGHIVTWPSLTLEQALEPLADLRAPLGVFAVLGNHDQPYWTRRVMARDSVKLLVGAAVDVGPVALVGARSRAMPPDPACNLRSAVDSAPDDKPLIVLVHEPDYFETMPKRVQLMIAGHTHGGQIVLPLLGTRRIGPFYDTHLRGLFREHGQTLVVSSGLSTSVLPVRIGVRPEIVEILLVPAAMGEK